MRIDLLWKIGWKYWVHREWNCRSVTVQQLDPLIGWSSSQLGSFYFITWNRNCWIFCVSFLSFYFFVFDTLSLLSPWTVSLSLSYVPCRNTWNSYFEKPFWVYVFVIVVRHDTSWVYNFNLTPHLMSSGWVLSGLKSNIRISSIFYYHFSLNIKAPTHLHRWSVLLCLISLLSAVWLTSQWLSEFIHSAAKPVESDNIPERNPLFMKVIVLSLFQLKFGLI